MKAPRLRRSDSKRGRRRRGGRAGHTLIEILLALGLSLVILTAVYAALDQHWRYAEAGQRQTERMQVTRALFERFTLDLRSVVFRRVAEPLQAIGSADVRRINVIQADEPYLRRSIGILGDGETLVVQINRPDIDEPQTVRWQMQALEAAARSANRPPQITAAATQRVARGLARIAARANASLASVVAAQTASPNSLLASEVETIRFRYFARGSWFDQWDSVDRQELPQAVEVTIGFREANPLDQKTNVPKRVGEYRLLVAIPSAEA